MIETETSSKQQTADSRQLAFCFVCIIINEWMNSHPKSSPGNVLTRPVAF